MSGIGCECQRTSRLESRATTNIWEESTVGVGVMFKLPNYSMDRGRAGHPVATHVRVK